MSLLKQSTSVTLRIGPFLDKTDGVTEETALGLAATDVQISKAGGAFANKSDATAPAHDSDGWYSCVLNATDTGTVGRLVVKVHDSTTHLPVWHEFMVLPANAYDSLVGGTDTLQADVTQWNGSAVNALIAGRVDSNPGAMQTGVITASAVATDAIGSSQFAQAAADKAWSTTTRTLTDKAGFALSAAEHTAIEGDIWDADATSHQTQGTFGQAIGDPAADTSTIWGLCNTNLDATVSSRLAASSAPTNFADLAITATTGKVTVGTNDDKTGYSISGTKTTLDALNDLAASDVGTQLDNRNLNDLIQLTATVNDASPTTTSFITTLGSATDSFYNGVLLVFTSGSLSGLARRISAYVGSTKTVTLENALPAAPANGDAFSIIAVEVQAATAGSGDWSTTEKQQIRYRLGLDGTTNTPTASPDLSRPSDILTDPATDKIDGSAITEVRLAHLDADISSRQPSGNVTVGGYAASQDPGTYVLTTPAQKLATDATGRVTVASNADKTGYSLAADQSAATIGTVNALGTQAKTDVNTEVSDVLKTDTILELASIPAAAPTFEQALMFLYMRYRNKRTQTATQQKLHNDAGTAIVTHAVSDDGTTATVDKGA